MIVMTFDLESPTTDQSPPPPNPPPPRSRPDGLFVYGTLMPSKSETFKGLTGITKTNFSCVPAILYDHILWKVSYYPGIIPTPDPDKTKAAVLGEFINLSHLDDNDFDFVIARLDRYEGCPVLYQRKTVTVETPTANRSAFVYIWNSPITPSIQTGDISDVQAKDPAYTVLEWR